MKRILLFIMLLTAGLCSAQNFEVGMKVGYLKSRLSLINVGYAEGAYTSKSGIYVAFPLEYHLNRFFSAQAEVGVAGLGGSNLIIDGQVSDLNLTTVYAPIGIKFYPLPRRISLLLGVNFGVTTKAQVELDGKKTKLDNLNKNNHSLFIGTEIKIVDFLFIEARMNPGLTNIGRNQDVTLKNNFWQIGIGYIFNKF